MSLHWILIALFSLFGFSTAIAEEKKEEKETQTEEEIDIRVISKAFGHHLGKNIVSPELVNLDLESIIKGIKEEAEGKTAPLSEADFTKAITKIQEKKFAHAAKVNLQKAVTFMAENMKNKQIVELEKGKLQYKIVKQGKGKEVQKHSTPIIHYACKYLDGKEFSSSYDSEPISLALDEAIGGFAKGIVGMKEHEKRILYIHPDLGYSNQSSMLSPNSLLIVEVEVIQADTLPSQPENDFSEEEHHKISMQ